LPLPSSPHWAPTITAVLPFFNFRSVRKIRAVVQTAAPGSHTASPVQHTHKIVTWDNGGRRCVLTSLTCWQREWQRVMLLGAMSRYDCEMVGAAGLEPATTGLEIRCSIQLSYAPATTGQPVLF
jgi:hypothetical protein